MIETAVQTPAQSAADIAHVAALHATVRDVLELLAQLRARWIGYSVWRHGQPEVCIRLSSEGDLPGWLDAQRTPAHLVQDETGDARWHARVRNALITWPHTPRQG